MGNVITNPVSVDARLLQQEGKIKEMQMSLFNKGVLRFRVTGIKSPPGHSVTK